MDSRQRQTLIDAFAVRTFGRVAWYVFSTALNAEGGPASLPASDIGRRLGCSRQAVTKAIAGLTRAGILAAEGRLFAVAPADRWAPTVALCAAPDPDPRETDGDNPELSRQPPVDMPGSMDVNPELSRQPGVDMTDSMDVNRGLSFVNRELSCQPGVVKRQPGVVAPLSLSYSGEEESSLTEKTHKPEDNSSAPAPAPAHTHAGAAPPARVYAGEPTPAQRAARAELDAVADRAEEWFPGSDVGYQMRAGLRGFTVPQWSAALEVLRTRPRGQWRFQYLMGILRGIAANGMPEPVAPAGRVAVGGGPPPELDDAELIRRAQARRAAREERKKGWAK